MMRKSIILLVSVFVFVVTSCTNNEELEVKYQTEIRVSFSEFMSSFVEFFSDDFEILEGKSIRLRSYIYNEEGHLVTSYISSVDNYISTISFSPVLKEGDYRIVSISDFINGAHYSVVNEYWFVSGEENINTLTVSDGEYMRPWFDETLGVVVSDVSVKGESQIVEVSMKPATALVQVYFDYSDKYNGDGSGVSVYAPFCTDLYIYTKSRFAKVTGFDDMQWHYASSYSQSSVAVIMRDCPMETVNDNYRANYGYRAIFPQKRMSFLWDITLMLPDGTILEESSAESDPIDIEAGKQYELRLSLDELMLYVNEVKSQRLAQKDYQGDSRQLDSSLNRIKNKSSFEGQSYRVIDIVR